MHPLTNYLTSQLPTPLCATGSSPLLLVILCTHPPYVPTTNELTLPTYLPIYPHLYFQPACVQGYGVPGVPSGDIPNPYQQQQTGSGQGYGGGYMGQQGGYGGGGY